MLKEIALQEFLDLALKKGEIQDRIIDEHHLLLYIKFVPRDQSVLARAATSPGPSLVQ